MKMLIAVLRDEDSENISHALVESKFRVTRIASTGGFFRRGSTTLLVGIADEKVDEAIQVIRQNCAPAAEPGAKRATLFVLNVAHFEQI
ncbi:MAG TPA: cyclic-di-AMP receptor [Anaerolineales bacterium]|nr:cyclic-di-AMP receptor [Anaerolineales bacterium]